MSDLMVVIQVIAGLFAIYGICAFIRRLTDMFVICKAGAVCKIVVKSCNDDAEYAVRFAQSRFYGGDYGDFFDELEISDNVDMDDDTFIRLQKEFGNLSR